MDFSWQAITYSPTNYSSVGRFAHSLYRYLSLIQDSCILATLSSNLEVQLWAPKSHAYRGEWTKV